LQNARFAYEKEQKLRTLREDAEVGWTLVVNWASDESQEQKTGQNDYLPICSFSRVAQFCACGY
jgi:hypothetical protein